MEPEESEYQQTLEQLKQLEELINLDPSNQEIISLYQNLEQLKELQEASLLEEKKRKLLNLVDGITSPSDNQITSSSTINDNNVETTTSATTTTTTNASSVEIFNRYTLDSENLKEGLKCCIPLENDGHVFFLPGMITEINEETDNCKVLLITPINENLIPCQKYNCNMKNCSRSHGIEINKGLVLSHDILDITSLKERSICFAKYEDSVWYLAKIIKRIEQDETANNMTHVKKFIIKYKGYDDYEEVTPDHIIPVCGMDVENVKKEWSDLEDDWLSNSDSDSSTTSDDSLWDSDNESTYSKTDSVSSSNISLSTADTLKIINDESFFGEWEKHTKGIGSLLMKKMGYKEGKGLGIDGEGIVNPIEIVIQPPGQGLDFEIDEIEELALKRQKEQEKRKQSLLKKKKEKMERKRKLKNSMDSIDSDVFDFLNVSINKKAKGKMYAIETKSKINDQTKENENDGHISKRKKSSIDSKQNKKENNLKLLQIQKQIRDLNHQIERAKERYERNKIRDKVVAEHYKSKIEEFKKILYTSELKEKQVKNSISNSKKLHSKFEF